MKTTKKTIAILAILAIVCCSAFATETQTTAERSGWSVNAGTAYIVSHIGASYSLGRWEFGGNLYSGFPNIPIIAYANGASEPFFEIAKQALTVAYAGNINALYDVTRSDNVDVDLGLAVSGLYSNLEAIGLSGAKLGIVALDLGARLRFNVGNHSGIYLATEVPLAGVLFANSKNSTTEESTTEATFFAPLTESYLQAVLTLVLYTTRIGYTYSF